MYQNEENETSRYEKIKQYLAEINEPKYRFGQIVEAIFKQNINDFNKMTNIAKPLREELEKRFGPILSLKPIDKQKSFGVKKILFELKDKEKIESVRMTYRDWQSLCVSSQVGCSLKCSFCATGKIGLKRNLTVDEINDQVFHFISTGSKIRTVSFMGMGEPFLNPAVFLAIKDLTDPNLFGFSQRRINVSTVGVVPGLEKLIDQFPQINIAFSLHSPFEEQRKELMPISKKYSIESVLAILDKHIEVNMRKVFLSYLMIDNVNDSSLHVKELILIIKQRKNNYLYHVNLIAYHPISKSDKFQSSTDDKILWFKRELERARVGVTLRHSPGQSIKAACGQLHAQYQYH